MGNNWILAPSATFPLNSSTLKLEGRDVRVRDVALIDMEATSGPRIVASSPASRYVPPQW